MTCDSFTAPDYDHAALLTIDVQVDTLDRRPFEVPGTSDVLPDMAKVVKAFRTAGKPIVHILRIYKPDGSNADLCRRKALGQGVSMFLKGSVGRRVAEPLLPGKDLEFDDDLLLSGGIQELGPNEVAIFKPRFGAFFQTPLADHLKEKNINTTVFCGSNFPNCPRTSIYQAVERDFRVVAVEDAISGIYDKGKKELENIGVQLIRSDDLLKTAELTC